MLCKFSNTFSLFLSFPCASSCCTVQINRKGLSLAFACGRLLRGWRIEEKESSMMMMMTWLSFLLLDHDEKMTAWQKSALERYSDNEKTKTVDSEQFFRVRTDVSHFPLPILVQNASYPLFSFIQIFLRYFSYFPPILLRPLTSSTHPLTSDCLFFPDGRSSFCLCSFSSFLLSSLNLTSSWDIKKVEKKE